MRPIAGRDDECVPLLRAGGLVNCLGSAFGGGLRETRVTAMLGYLIARCPHRFDDLFALTEPLTSVHVETNHHSGRSDILMSSSRDSLVVEAKLDTTDAGSQVKKYPGRRRVVLSGHLPSSAQRSNRGLSYVSWHQLGDALKKIAGSEPQPNKFLALELIRYLEDHAVIPRDRAIEIYCREINNEPTLNLFLKTRMYTCDYEKSARVSEALYFAPHFGQAIAAAHPGIVTGISYLARIEVVHVVDSRQDSLQAIATERGKTFLKQNKEHIATATRRWRWPAGHRRTLLFLGEPRLVFNPPVKKENLQKGKGWLSKRTFDFDQLFAGWKERIW